MSTSIQKKATWQRLNETDDSRVWIEPRTGESFGLPIDDVIRACKYQERLQEFIQQLGDLTEHLAKWMSARSPEVDRGYLTLEPDGVVFVVVRKDKRFDPDFEDALSDLDLGVANDVRYSLVRMRTLALPYSAETTVSSFVDTSRGLVWSSGDSSKGDL